MPIRGRGVTCRTTASFSNRPAIRQAVIPAAGISTTAGDLACFYQALLSGGESNGVRVLTPRNDGAPHLTAVSDALLAACR